VILRVRSSGGECRWGVLLFGRRVPVCSGIAEDVEAEARRSNQGRTTHRRTCWPSNTNSIIAPARSSKTVVRPTYSPPCQPRMVRQWCDVD
jgi:hypothetical protein